MVTSAETTHTKTHYPKHFTDNSTNLNQFVQNIYINISAHFGHCHYNNLAITFLFVDISVVTGPCLCCGSHRIVTLNSNRNGVSHANASAALPGPQHACVAMATQAFDVLIPTNPQEAAEN